MNTKKEDKLREDLKILLRELASKQDLLENKSSKEAIYKKLENIYVPLENGQIFRHYYSDIFGEMINIHQNPELGTIEVLGENLRIIKADYDPQIGKKDVSDSINKLYDHISLEMARITYSDMGDRKASQSIELSNMSSQVEGIKLKIKSAEKELDKQKNELDKQQREYISILGIFAAIVLSFTSGITFSTSALGNISNASVYRLIIVALVTGLVIVNALYGLFHCIDRILVKPSQKSITSLIITNIVFILLIIGIIILWYIGFIERRNHRIERVEIIQETSVESDPSAVSSN